MNDRMTCRNALLKEIVYIRRATHKLLGVRGSGLSTDLDGCVTASVLNINHGLNAIETMIEGCRHDGDLEGQDQATRRLAVDSIP